MISFELDLRAVRASFRTLGRALDDELERAVRTTSRAIRDEAKSSHSYTDRTGRLTRSIVAAPTSGRFTQDNLEGAVVATMPYASFVEEGTTRARAFEYLGTAWTLQRDEAQANIEDALERALWRAGL